MKTAAVTRLGSLRAEDPKARGIIEVIDLPELPLGPEDVRIAVAFAAICGSDPHIAEGAFGTETPIGIGHEISGTIVELGTHATKKGLALGDRVAGNFLRFCGTCDFCLEGKQQFCRYIQEYNRPGMAESIVWHESQVYKLPDTVSLEEGCLLEPTSVAVRIADKAAIKVGATVAICGGGPIGQLALQIMKRSGATSLTLIEPIAERRAMALRLGADHVIDPVAGGQQAEADDITGGLGFDVVIDASGSPRAVEGLLPLVTRGGTLIYGAVYPAEYQMPLNLFQYCYFNELTITGVFVSPYAFPRAVRVLADLDLSEFTTTIIPLDRVGEAFETHLSGKHPKVIVSCSTR
jgi:L-iditol 2-dehydrogenase